MISLYGLKIGARVLLSKLGLLTLVIPGGLPRDIPTNSRSETFFKVSTYLFAIVESLSFNFA
jgi:hypothetical protein